MSYGPPKTFKLRLQPPQERKAYHVGKFEIPKRLEPLDLARWAQPIRMARQGYEDKPPAPEAEPGSKLQQAQLTDLRVRSNFRNFFLLFHLFAPSAFLFQLSVLIVL